MDKKYTDYCPTCNDYVSVHRYSGNYWVCDKCGTYISGEDPIMEKDWY